MRVRYFENISQFFVFDKAKTENCRRAYSETWLKLLKVWAAAYFTYSLIVKFWYGALKWLKNSIKNE